MDVHAFVYPRPSYFPVYGVAEVSERERGFLCEGTGIDGMVSSSSGLLREGIFQSSTIRCSLFFIFEEMVYLIEISEATRSISEAKEALREKGGKGETRLSFGSIQRRP